MAREYDMGDEFSHIYSDNFLDLQALMFFGWLANYGITITKEDKNKDNKNFDRIITSLEKAEQSFENKDHKTILKTIGRYNIYLDCIATMFVSNARAVALATKWKQGAKSKPQDHTNPQLMIWGARLNLTG
eukprot:1746584-Ditylum_brightwellii.AAC.1